ncbi:hypothetical protein ACTXG6_34415 [Pseudonocardia sp. Cha107L01]|uniref:hypothetical protein n=1 Tax=Pseudonocardia sp. Cha107L01 TaxID=3457576 RepID=UPI00403EB94B
MAIQIHVLLDDGPRGGATLTIDSSRGGVPPQQLVLDSLLGTGTTTYYLHGLDEHRRGYVYRVGPPE